MIAKPYEFESFPRGTLPVRFTRRQFFAGLIQEIQAFGQTEERPFFRLADLGSLPDIQLAHMIPAPIKESETYNQDGYVWGKAAAAKMPVRLFPAGCEASYVLEQFNSTNSIVQVGRNLSIHTGMEKQRAFAYTRGVFLWLVLAKLYEPLE